MRRFRADYREKLGELWVWKARSKVWTQPLLGHGQVDIDLPGVQEIRRLGRLTWTILHISDERTDCGLGINRHEGTDSGGGVGREAPPSYPGPDFPSSGAGVCCFSSALAVCSSYASKATLFLIRPHIYGKLSQAQTLEELVLGKLRAFASSYWNMHVSNQLVGLQCTHTGAFSRTSYVFPWVRSSSLFLFVTLSYYRK